MRVRCIDNVDEIRTRHLHNGRRIEEHFPHLTVGKVYDVVKHDGQIVYIIADDGTEIPYRWNRFCVVNDVANPTPRRFLRVVDARNCAQIKNGDLYELLGESYIDGYTRSGDWAKQTCYTITNRKGLRQEYEGWRFVIESDSSLPNGWRYCKCGTTTSNNDLCCDCKGKS